MRSVRLAVLALLGRAALAAALLIGTSALALDPPASPKAAGKAPGFDAKLVDPAVDPCKDFFQYACGTWIRSNPIPPEFPSWGRFQELAERNREELHRILEQAAPANPKRDELHQKIGDYYASCMDEARAEAEGAKPLAPAFQRIAALEDAKAVVLEAARHRRQGVGSLFSFSSTPDARDAREVIAEADQGGLGLPDRDYYTKDDAKSKELRDQYVAHMTRMFQLAGDTPEAAATEAARVMTLETALAKGSMTRVERRNPEKRYNRMKAAELETLAPSIPWQAYIAETGLAPVPSLNVGSPGYFKTLDELLKTAALDDWKSYLRWHVIRAAAPRLSSAFVNEEFAFSGKTLTGAKQLQPRWHRCVAATDMGLRDLLGKPYVEATFGEDGKKRMLAMVNALKGAMDEDLSKVPWMDDETRGRAKAKLDAFGTKIGYPDKWMDTSGLKVDRGSFLENARRVARFHFDHELAKVGKPVDKTEWRMSAPTVNASYSPQYNQITFPAGILQPPFFDKAMDDAPNFGGIGAVIGHEISHGFDDQGSQFDKDGNLKSWWTEKSNAEFKKRTSCVERQFSDYVAIDDLHVNGKLTLGENIGDLGGLKIALAALKKTAAGKPPAEMAAKIDGFTPEQRFFLGWATVWCRNATPEQQRLQVNTDPHAPAQFRVNGPLSNMKEFQAAFACPQDAPMVRKALEVCEVW
jgi:putative endopeptidase